MSRSLRPSLQRVEDDGVDRERETGPVAVNKVDRLEIPLEMAKARFGAAVNCAIGDRPMKEFGDKGMVSNVVKGEKVPEYLARIYQDPVARRRFALALLSETRGVTVETVIRWTEED